MGWFGKWFGGRRDLSDPEALRAALWDAAERDEQRELDELCREHGAAILQAFPAWQKPPPELQKDDSAMQAYIHGLLGVARTFERAGDAQLLERLVPKGGNPITRIEGKLESAQLAIDELEYDLAISQLRELIDSMTRTSGSAVDRYLPIAHGYLARCHFHDGSALAAREPAQRALQLCEKTRDLDGVRAYRSMLYEIARYLGEAESAAVQADALSALYDGPEAAWYGAQAALLRRGEPLNRIILTSDSKRYEQGSLPKPVNGAVQFVYQRNRITLAPAERAIEQGKSRGSEADYTGSLELFERAAKLDAFTPEPHYHRGLSLLHLRRYAEAALSYERCEELAPGWYHCRTDLWLARQLASGSVSHELLLAHLSLSDSGAPAAERLDAATHALQQAPGVALLHYHRGKSLEDLRRPDEARQSFASGLSLACDAGTRTRLLAHLGNVQTGAERRASLQQASELEGDRVSAAMARLLLEMNA